MCFCDGEYFVITNKTTGSVHFVNGDDDIHTFFEGFYSIPQLFHRMIKREQIRWKDNYYTLAVNSHPECEQVKRTIPKYGDQSLKDLDGGFWGKCSEKYRHLLPKERQ
jgi:hypothetical protein